MQDHIQISGRDTLKAKVSCRALDNHLMPVMRSCSRMLPQPGFTSIPLTSFCEGWAWFKEVSLESVSLSAGQNSTFSLLLFHDMVRLAGGIRKF